MYSISYYYPENASYMQNQYYEELGVAFAWADVLVEAGCRIVEVNKGETTQ